MDFYIPNRHCYCSRCRYRGFMGPVVLITLGALFLVSEFTNWHFHQTWPILLIAIGIVKVMGSSADTGGHIAPTLPDRLRYGCAPGAYTGYTAGTAQPAAGPAPSQNPEPPQGVNHV